MVKHRHKTISHQIVTLAPQTITRKVGQAHRLPWNGVSVGRLGDISDGLRLGRVRSDGAKRAVVIEIVSSWPERERAGQSCDRPVKKGRSYRPLLRALGLPMRVPLPLG